MPGHLIGPSIITVRAAGGGGGTVFDRTINGSAGTDDRLKDYGHNRELSPGRQYGPVQGTRWRFVREIIIIR